MNLTPQSAYPSTSPSHRYTFRHTGLGHTPHYPTPPQSRAQTEVLAGHSPTATGLGILNCGVQSPSTQIGVCTPSHSLFQSPQAWQPGCNSAQGYPNHSPNMGAFPDMAIYENLDHTPSTRNPSYMLSNSQIPTAPTFFLSPPQTRRSGGTILQQQQRFSPSYEDAFQYHSPATEEQFTRSRHGAERDSNDFLKRGYGSQDEDIYQQQQQQHQQHQHQQQAPNCSAPDEYSGNVADMLFELDRNTTRVNVNARASRPALRSSSSNVTTPMDPACSSGSAMRNNASSSGGSGGSGGSGVSGVTGGGVKKQTKRRTNPAARRYECEKCGSRFTRNSNCKSHMKIHDPDREFPHKCTMPQCSKMFSRKTDLVRHVDSVSNYVFLFSPISTVLNFLFLF